MTTSRDEGRRTLLLMRHAKSSWAAVGQSDFERPLAPRGERDAPRLGRWISENLDSPDCVVCSPARRAADTARLVLDAAGREDAEIVWDERIYGGGVRDLLTIVSELPNASTALLVGHYPGMWELTEFLSGSPVTPEPGQKPFPTAALAVLRTDLAWGRIAASSAELVTVVRPRLLD